MDSIKEKVLFIINPISGVGKQKTVEKAIEKSLDKSLFDYDIEYTEYAHHASLISLRATLEGYNSIIAVGGDGSINDCVRGLVGSKSYLGIIPAGSGNGLARHLRIPLDIGLAIEVINQNNRTSIDTIKVNSRIYASIAGVGFDALIAKEFQKSKTRGLNKYLSLVLQHYPLYEPKIYRLEIDNEIIETEALFISFANSNQFGYNAIIAPNAELDDGFIDISIVRKIPMMLLPWTAQLLFTKNFDKSIYVTNYKAKTAKLVNDESRLVNLDGESVVMERDLSFSILPKSLNIIIPKNYGKEKKEPYWSSIFDRSIFSI